MRFLRFAYITLALVFLTISNFGQIPTRFYSQNPFPNDKALQKPFMVSGLVGYISGYYSVLKTTDGGSEWKSMPYPAADLTDLYFFNTTQGVALGADKIFYTNDGAQTWLEASTPVPSGGYAISFADNSFGLIGSLGRLLRTTNGGVSWDTLPYSSETGFIYSVSFADLNIAYAGTSGGKILKTTNRGTTWSVINFPDCDGKIIRNLYASGNTVFMLATGNGDPVLKSSTDGGATFNDISLPDQTINSFHFRNAGHGYMTAAHGKLYSFIPNSFIMTDIGFDKKLYAVHFGDPYHAILISDPYESPQIIFSYDGLVPAWYQRTSVVNTNLLKRSSFLDTNNGWIVGDNGTILRTTNGGYDWNSQISNTTVNLRDVYFLNYKTGFAVGNSGVILKTTDAGNTWENIATLGTNLQSVFFTNLNTGYCGGDGGNLYKTTNAGSTWSPLSSGLTQIMKIFFTSPMSGYAGGYGMAKTTDGGNTWTNIVSPAQYVYDIEFTDINTGYYGSVYAAYKTTNAGTSWEITFPAPGYYIYDISFTDENNGCMVGPYNLGNTSVIARTTNGGTNWHSTLSHTLYSTQTMMCQQLDKKNMLAGTRSGNIARTIDDSIIVRAGTVYGTPGTNVEIPVIVHFPRLYKAGSVELYLHYDSLLTQFVEFEIGGTITGAAGWNFYGYRTATGLNVAGIGADDIKKGGDIVKLRMKVKEGASGVIPIIIDSVRFNTGEVFAEKIHGKIIVDQIVYGDVDLNGFIQAYDGALILKYLLGYVTLNELQLRNADVTIDGSVSALDAAVIARYVIREILTLPFTGTGPAAAVPGMENVTIHSLAVFNLPVNLENAVNLFSVQARLNFNPEFFVFEDFTPSPAFSSFLFEVKNNGDHVLIAGAAPDSVQADSVNLGSFRLRPRIPFGQSAVTLSQLRLNENPVINNAASSVIRFVTGARENGVPERFLVHQNFPNPFNPFTTVNFELPVNSGVLIEVYTILGEKVLTVSNGEFQAGYHSAVIDCMQMGSGIYILRFSATDMATSTLYTSSQRMVLMK